MFIGNLCIIIISIISKTFHIGFSPNSIFRNVLEFRLGKKRKRNLKFLLWENLSEFYRGIFAKINSIFL